MSNTNKIVLTVVALLVLGVGGFYVINSQRRSGSTKQGQIIQSHRSYELEVTSDTSNIKPKRPTTLSYKIKNERGEVLKNYETAHEKIMHFIVVRNDLQYFQHLHPEYNQSTGEFNVEVTFPIDGPYRIYPDFTPGEDNPQKLPVTVFSDVDVGDQSKYLAQPIIADTETNKAIEDYQIAFTVPKIKAQEEFIYSLEINENGQPVTDLEKYLGALGHSVILKADTLDFIHTHALEATSEGSSTEGHNMDAMQKDEVTNVSGPEINFRTTLPESGIYKIFTQFQHQGVIKTVDYIVDIL